MTEKLDMNSLARGDQFVGPDGRTRYEVVTPASEHERGWVDVRNLSMTDSQAAALVAERPHSVEWTRDPMTGEVTHDDPRDGFFCFSHPVYVERVNAELAPAAVTEVDAAPSAERKPEDMTAEEFAAWGARQDDLAASDYGDRQVETYVDRMTELDMAGKLDPPADQDAAEM